MFFLNKQVFIGRKKLRYYKNILMRVDLFQHEQIFSYIKENVSKGSKICDFGSGEGALAQRLYDNGYEVTALDQHDYFKAKGCNFIQVNFDNKEELETFIKKNSNEFDAVIGIEVIEHVHDQWAYITNMSKLCKDDGYLFISTPNTSSWLSRILFLLTGRFHQFGDLDLSYGHISPLSLWEFKTILNALNFKDFKFYSIGTLPPIYISSLKTFLATLLGLLFRPFQKGKLNGWNILAVIKNEK